MDKEYTPWRQFLAWVGFATLLGLVALVVYLLVGDVESICLSKIN